MAMHMYICIAVLPSDFILHFYEVDYYHLKAKLV